MVHNLSEVLLVLDQNVAKILRGMEDDADLLRDLIRTHYEDGAIKVKDISDDDLTVAIDLIEKTFKLYKHEIFGSIADKLRKERDFRRLPRPIPIRAVS